MTLKRELAQAVRDGDAERVRDLVVGANEKERRAAAGEAERLLIARERNTVAPLAFVGTATAREVSTWSWAASEAAEHEVVTEILAARGRGFVETLVRALSREDVQLWRLIRAAVRAGIVERPADEAWIRGMIAGVGGWGTRRLESVYEGLLADPELLEEDVWRLFEVDCGSELRWAVTYSYGEELRLEHGDNVWTYALTRLAAEGRLDRQRLLDASLDALVRDFRGSTIGWYVRFHEELAPTREEREARLDRYLTLLASPIPIVAKAGLTGLRAIEDQVPPQELARAALAPLAQRQKGLASETLSLLARAAARDTDARPALLEAAAHGAAHERADVQERALALVERYADEPESTTRARAVLLGLADAVTPRLRARLESVTGFAAEREPPPPVEPVPRHEPRRERLTLEEALRTVPPLASVESVDELIELAASLLEGQGTGDDAERFLDGVSRLCGERPPERLTAGLLKRARETSTASLYDLGGDSLVATVVRAWAAGERPPKRSYRGSAVAFLLDRINAVAARVARQQPRPLLAFPTHSGGWLDPNVLAERELGFGRFRNRADPADRAQAAVRAAALPPPLLEPRIERRKRWEFSDPEPNLAFRVDGNLPPLGPLKDAVLALERGNDDRFWWAAAPAWGGPDTLSAHWCLTVVPSLPEFAFAGAAAACVDAIDGGTVYEHPEVTLQYALDPAVPLPPIAWLAVAAALLGKAEDARRPTVDLLVQSIEDGRFDADELGRAINWLLQEQLGKLPRLAQPLRDVSRTSPAHATHVLAAIEALLAGLATTPIGAHAFLELAVEIAAATGRRIESAAARSTLEEISDRFSKSAKLSKLARDLLNH